MSPKPHVVKCRCALECIFWYVTTGKPIWGEDSPAPRNFLCVSRTWREAIAFAFAFTPQPYRLEEAS